MSGNTFGTLFCVTSFGESHGPAIGCVVDGCPPGLALDRSRHPARTRPPQARHVAPRHAAARVRHRRDPVRRVRGPHHRHADRAADPQRGPAQQGLREHRRHVPARARRLHVLAEVRHPRLPRRRPAVGARDGGARRRRRHRQEVAGRALRRAHSRPPDAARAERDSLRGLGTRRRQSVLRRQRRRSCPNSRRSWTACASPATPAARASRSWPAACRSAGASRSTASSTPTSPPR